MEKIREWRNVRSAYDYYGFTYKSNAPDNLSKLQIDQNFKKFFLDLVIEIERTKIELKPSILEGLRAISEYQEISVQKASKIKTALQEKLKTDAEGQEQDWLAHVLIHLKNRQAPYYDSAFIEVVIERLLDLSQKRPKTEDINGLIVLLETWQNEAVSTQDYETQSSVKNLPSDIILLKIDRDPEQFLHKIFRHTNVSDEDRLQRLENFLFSGTQADYQAFGKALMEIVRTSRRVLENPPLSYDFIQSENFRAFVEKFDKKAGDLNATFEPLDSFGLQLCIQRKKRLLKNPEIKKLCGFFS